MDHLAHDTCPPQAPEPEVGPTPSRNTNRLIACFLDAAFGRLDADSLRLALANCGLELAEAKSAFSTQVQEEPGLLEALPEALEAVVDAFDAYGDVLARACVWLTHRDPGILQASAEALAKAYLQLNDALIAYEWAYLGHGDEPHPALNLMQKAKGALRQRLMEDDRFSEILDRLWDHFEDGVRVFQQDPESGRAIRGARACQEALDGIQIMDGYFAAHDLAVLETGFARFRQGCLLLVEQVQESTGEALVKGPTPSPQVNWVIHAARAVLDGLAAELLQRAQAWFEVQLSDSYFSFEQCATIALKGPARAAEQVPVAREGFDWLNRALPLLRLGAQVRELLPRAIENLEKGATLLYEAWMILELYEQEETTSFCPRCGSSNREDARECGSCGGRLVTAAEKTVAIPGLAVAGVSSHLERLVSACEAAECGQMSTQEFASVLTWAEQILKEADLGLTRLPPEESLPPEATQAMRELRLGIAEFRVALAELGRFVQDGQPVHVTNGSRLLVQACNRLAEVQQLALGG